MRLKEVENTQNKFEKTIKSDSKNLKAQQLKKLESDFENLSTEVTIKRMLLKDEVEQIDKNLKGAIPYLIDSIRANTLLPKINILTELDKKITSLKEEIDHLKREIDTPEAVSYSVNKYEQLFNSLKFFLNSGKLLPHNSKFEQVDIEGNILFVDGHGEFTKVTEMSDGFRSILSLTFELIRQLTNTYGQELVFSNIETSNSIDLPGVVLMDEIDAHLHPTWQTRIGEWFTNYFPNIQFIVSTHSPLVCRAAEKGTIWRLASPGSNQLSGEIVGTEREKLVFGNILDAYGTEVFGDTPVRGAKGEEKLERLGELNVKSALGKINDSEEKERKKLQKIFTTDAATGYK